MRRLAVGFNGIWADIYWISAIQYYGDTKLSVDQKKNYDQLYPLLDITTSLDPHFNIAYRLGSILLVRGLSERARPDRAGDRAAAEGHRARCRTSGSTTMTPASSSTWWRRDVQAAADWFIKGSKLPGAPSWMEPLAASVLAEGGERDAAREMWLQLAEHRRASVASAGGQPRSPAARRRGAHRAARSAVVHKFYDMHGRFPRDLERDDGEQDAAECAASIRPASTTRSIPSRDRSTSRPNRRCSRCEAGRDDARPGSSCCTSRCSASASAAS